MLFKASVVVPIDRLDGLTSCEIGECVKSLVHKAEILFAEEIASMLLQYKHQNDYSQSLDCSYLNMLEPFTEDSKEIAEVVSDMHTHIERERIAEEYSGTMSGFLLKRRKEFASIRPKILPLLIARDGLKCAAASPECSGDITVDHIHPLSKGGSDEIDNLRLLCRYHNSKKRDTVLEN